MQIALVTVLCILWFAFESQHFEGSAGDGIKERQQMIAGIERQYGDSDQHLVAK